MNAPEAETNYPTRAQIYINSRYKIATTSVPKISTSLHN